VDYLVNFAKVQKMAYIFANWKSALTSHEAMMLYQSLLNLSYKNVTIAVFPSVQHVMPIYEICLKTGLRTANPLLGLQNCAPSGISQQTGETLLTEFKNIITYVLCGHSERRRMGEDCSLVIKKAQYAYSQGVIPVLCVGETLEERAKGLTSRVIAQQLEGSEDIPRLLVAYEPVWSIGSGNPAKPHEIEKVIKENILSKVPHAECLYGGSVDAENCVEFLDIPTIKGLLIGGASQNITSFSSLIKKCIPQ